MCSWRSQSIKIGTDLPIEKLIKIGKFDLIDIDWQSNNVVLVHYTEKGGIIELQRVTQLSTATEVEPIENACVAVVPFPLTPSD